MIIDAVYDFLCPWCLVGKRHLDLALEAERVRPDALAVQVRWRQYMLYPHFDRGGHDFLAFFREKYGETLRVPMWDAIRRVAEPLGIRFRFEAITRGPASLDGHRLVRWAEARRAGVAGGLYEAIARGFFEQAQVIDEDFLVELAARHDFDADAARAHLRSDADLREPFAETEAWRAAGVTSMPAYRLAMPDGTAEWITTTSVQAFADAFDRARTLSRAA